MRESEPSGPSYISHTKGQIATISPSRELLLLSKITIKGCEGAAQSRVAFEFENPGYMAINDIV